MRPALSANWKYAGRTGASRALDYAVVDHFFINYLAFLSGLALIEQEGGSAEQYLEVTCRPLAYRWIEEEAGCARRYRMVEKFIARFFGCS